MSPILPLRTELPVRYLQGLKASTKQRRRRAEVMKDGYEIDRVDSWDLWVSQLIKQYKEGNKVEKSSRADSGLGSGSDKMDSAKLHPPHLTSTGGPAPGVHRALIRQGPVVFSPGPEETDDDTEESYASDIAITSSSTREDDDEERSSGESIKAMCIAWSSGRVDIGHLMTASEPVWVEDHVSQVLQHLVRANDYAGFTSDQHYSTDLGIGLCHRVRSCRVTICAKHCAGCCLQRHDTRTAC